MEEINIKSKVCPKCGGEGVLIHLNGYSVYTCNDCDFVQKGKWNNERSF